MVNEIIKGISMALNAAFGDEYEVYANDVEQGLSPGSFFINTLQMSLSPLLGGRALKTNSFDILYFPKTIDIHMECYSVAETLMDGLRLITLPNGDQLFGREMRYEIQDDVLHFFVNYMEIRYGIVTEVSPLKITLTQKAIPIEGDMIIRGTEPAITLQENDKVILLQNRKGQQYYILGKR